MSDIDRVPIAAGKSATPIEISILLVQDRTRCRRDNFHFIVVHLQPRKRPGENIQATVVVAGTQVICSVAAMEIQQRGGVIRVMVDKI